MLINIISVSDSIARIFNVTQSINIGSIILMVGTGHLALRKCQDHL